MNISALMYSIVILILLTLPSVVLAVLNLLFYIPLRLVGLIFSPSRVLRNKFHICDSQEMPSVVLTATRVAEMISRFLQQLRRRRQQFQREIFHFSRKLNSVAANSLGFWKMRTNATKKRSSRTYSTSRHSA